VTNLGEGLFPGKQRKTIDNHDTGRRNRCFPKEVLERHRCIILFCRVLWKLMFCHKSEKPITDTGSYKQVP
jgi:hypothetical protein